MASQALSGWRPKNVRRALASTTVALTVVGGAAAAVAALSASAAGEDIYVAPGGSATAAGTLAAPTTLEAAISRVTPGGTIRLRGGTYTSSQTLIIPLGNDGTPGALKTIAAYPGETPVLDFSPMAEDPANRGLKLEGNYWRLTGFVVERAGDNGIYVSGSYNVLERMVTRKNRDTGLQIGRQAATTARADWPSDNLVVSSESYDNRDAAGENADGFAAKLTVGPRNVFRYDVAHNNIDDGWDLFAKPDTGPIDPVTIEDSLSFSNGTLTDGTQAASGDRNGFKLGGSKIAVDHVIRRSVAYGNGQHGFTWNSNPGNITVADNLSIDNTQRNFAFDGGTSTFTNDTSCRFTGSVTDKITGTADSSNQFWSGSNGSRCANYSGALTWSFAADGKLQIALGGKSITPSTSPAPTTTTKPAPTTTTAPTTTKPAPTTSTTAPTTSTPAVTTTAPATTTPATTTPAPTTTAPTTSTGGAALFSDGFGDGDTAGWTFSGGTWAVKSGALTQSAAASALAITGSSTWTGVDVSATAVTTAVKGSGANVALLAGVQSASDYYALVLRDANKVELRRVVAGRTVVLATAKVQAAVGRSFALRLVVSGGKLTGYVDGKALVTANDSTFGSGKVAVGSYHAAARFDDVSVRRA